MKCYPKRTSSANAASKNVKQTAKKKVPPYNDKENSQTYENIVMAAEDSFNEKPRGNYQPRKFEMSSSLSIGKETMEHQSKHLQRKEAFTYQPQGSDMAQLKAKSLLNTYQMRSRQANQSQTGSNTMQPIITINGRDSQFGQGFSQKSYQNQSLTESSNGKEIRGRKIDSPQLLVVREIKELDEEDEIPIDQIHGFGTGSDDLQNIIWNSRDFNQHHMQIDSPKRQPKPIRHSKSVENKSKLKSYKGKAQIYKELRKPARLSQTRGKGTKSQREVRSSMGFNELLNQMDKDVSIHHNSNLHELKNKTTHDLLKLELSGIRKPSALNDFHRSTNKSAKKGTVHSQKLQNKTRSKSRERKDQKPLKNAEHQFPLYARNKQGNIERSATKQPNGKTQSQASLGVSGSAANLLQSINRCQSRLHHPQTAPSNQKVTLNGQQQSPERKHKDHKHLGNIDQLIKGNIKKMKERETEERLQSQQRMEQTLKKKENLEQINCYARNINRERMKRKQLNSQPLNMHNHQQSQDFVIPQQHLNETQKHVLSKKQPRDWTESIYSQKQLQKQSQSQKIDFDMIKEQVKEKKVKGNKDHRKSYGLEFMDIKKEIEEELKTIDQKFKDTNISTLSVQRPLPRQGNSTHQSIQRIKIKNSQKQEVIEKNNGLERGPMNKVIIVKKDKIRRFMRAKKKEIQCQEKLNKREEISRAIRMQQNIIKLNNFCKKKLGKHQTFHKLPRKRNTTIQKPDEPPHQFSKKEIGNIEGKLRQQKASKELEQDLYEDSSKISTEFYEEYFRLINSIQKEQKEGKSRVIYSQLDTSHSQNKSNKRQLFKSSLTNVNTSESPISMTQQTYILSSPSNQSGKSLEKKKFKQRKSKQSLKKIKGSASRGSISRPPLGIKRHSKEQSVSQFQAPKNSRAESAPLLYQQSTRQHRQSLNNQSAQKLRATKEVVKETFDQEEAQRFQYFVLQVVKIQRAFRDYLYLKGFYYLNCANQEVYATVECGVDTVHREEGIQRHEDVDGTHEAQELDNGESDDNKLLVITQPNIDAEKKVIFMSNINSCSVPQSPKEEQSKLNSDQDIIKRVFEYKPDKNVLSRASSCVNQEISQKPSIQSLQSEVNQDDKHDRAKVHYGMRMFTGSESLLRELQHQTPKSSHRLLNIKDSASKSLSVPSHSSKVSNASNNYMLDLNCLSVNSKKQRAQPQNDQTSLSSQSLFERNSFQQFTAKKLGQLVHNNEFSNLINMREEALDYRQKRESKFIKKMLKTNMFSPRTGQKKNDQLERWVKVEKEEIHKTKTAFQQEWSKTVQMIEETQKNVDSMREKMKVSNDNKKSHQNMFNSQSSRNSSSSNLISVKQPSKRSIFEEEPQMSQRSLRQLSALGTKHDKENDQSCNLIDYLESRWKSQGVLSHEESKKKQSLSGQGIFIEDQESKDQSSQRSLNNRQILNRSEKYINVDVAEEKSLQRSGSQHDLSDLIRKSKMDYFESEEGVDDKEPNFAQFDSNQRLSSLHQTAKSHSSKKDEIKIQENEFDDEELEDLQQHVRKISSCQELEDIQSHESLLNESELNNYFQDQRFSLEDFKSLDKRKIFEDEDCQEDEAIEGELSTKRQLNMDDQSLSEQVRQPNQNSEANNNFLQTVPTEEGQLSLLNQKDLDHHQRVHTPEPELSQSFQQQNHYIFSSLKPGENIRISDILKKTQSVNAAESMKSFVVDSENTSQVAFQNQQISQVVVQQKPSTPSKDKRDQKLQQADQITDEIMLMLVSQNFIIPQRPLASTGEQIAGSQQAQEENQDIYIVDAQVNERQQRREILELKQRQLIEADLLKADLYMREVINALISSDYYPMDSQNQPMPNYHKQFLLALTEPIKKNELDMLNLLQTSEIGSYEHFETTINHMQYPILPVDLYLEIERMREEQLIKSMSSSGQEALLESSLQQESIHIHNKAIFDALNESLLKFRPYGLAGEPMPWSNKNRRLQSKVDIGSVDTEMLFQLVKQDAMRWIQTFSGSQPSQIFTFNQQTYPLSDEKMFDEELFQETRERRLALQLATEVIEGEHLWLNYDFEENQVKVDLSDMILEHLVEEAVLLLNKQF